MLTTALTALLTEAEKHGKRLLLLIDNIDLILQRIHHEDWALREVLQKQPPIAVVGTSARIMEATYTYDAAFYEFFRGHSLAGLTLDETLAVMRHLATQTQAHNVIRIVDYDCPQLQTLHHLTGGNPRTLVLLFEVLSRELDGDLFSNLKRLLDDVTPLYKARFEELSPQAQQILDAVALNWDPIVAAQLANTTHLNVNTVPSQLTRLVEQGILEKVPSDGKRQAFQVAERFFNIWYLMRASRRLRRRLLWLVQFLHTFFSAQQLQGHVHRLLHRNQEAQPEYLLAVAQSLDDVGGHSGLRGALEYNVLSAVMIMQVHDELVFELAEDALVDVRAEVIQLMESAASLRVPLVVDAGHGLNWDEAH